MAMKQGIVSKKHCSGDTFYFALDNSIFGNASHRTCFFQGRTPEGERCESVITDLANGTRSKRAVPMTSARSARRGSAVIKWASSITIAAIVSWTLDPHAMNAR
jgi:hypothetical protein